MGLVSVGLFVVHSDTVWPLCRTPKPPGAVSEPPDGTTDLLSRVWTVATVAVALCALSGALVFLLFGARECSRPTATSLPDELTNETAAVGMCKLAKGSYYVMVNVHRSGVFNGWCARPREQ
jgi:hypothetical protein